jgi:hypothetical protein
MIRHRRIALALAAWAVVLGTGVAQASPPFPFTVYGTVRARGAYVVAGTPVTALCDGVQYGSALAEIFDGQSVYSMNVNGDDPETQAVKEGCYPDEVVRFKIGDLDADQTANWLSEGFQELNLTALEPTLKPVYLPLVIR